MVIIYVTNGRWCVDNASITLIVLCLAAFILVTGFL